MNSVNLVGRLTRDPELKYGQSGKAYTFFCVAVNAGKDKANFIDCVAYDKQAEVLGEYTRKGSQVGISGYIRTDNYEKDGVKKKIQVVGVSRVELLEKKREDSIPNDYDPTAGNPAPAAPAPQGDNFEDDDEFPFR